MSKRLHCPKCHKPTSELYSPDYVCLDCVRPEIRKMYPLWTKEKQEKGKHA